MINNLVLESKFLTFSRNKGQPDKSLGDCDLCFDFAHLLSNFITLDRKRNLRKPGILPSFDTDASLFGE